MKRVVFAFRSVRQRLFAAAVLTSLVGLLISGAGLFLFDLHNHRQTTATVLADEARLLGHVTTAALQFDDKATATQHLGFLRSRPAIRAAAIYDAGGKVFASYRRADVPESEIPGVAKDSGTATQGDRSEAWHRVVADSELVGSVYMIRDLGVFKRVLSYAAIALVVLVVSLAISAMLSNSLQRSITTPIVEVSELAREVVERRDYTVRARSTTRDEVGMLVEAFNQMLTEIERRAGELESSNAEVTRLNRNLEQRVGERTRQLEDSNLQLQAANAAKSNFLAMMSHEIRTPMNGVLGMLELLSLSTLESEQRATLEVVRNSGRSLLRIIDDILDFSKIEAGKLDIQPEVVSVPKIVASVASIYSGNASSKGLSLRSSIDPRLSPALIVDPLRLQQILNNLVSNSVKFTSKGFVEISVEALENRGTEQLVRFTVSDSGIGISPEGQALLFQPFSQAGTEITRVFGGTGLGLSIGQRLATMMGGSITISSEPGKGTSVQLTLLLPVASADMLRPSDAEESGSAVTTVASRPGPPTVEQAGRDGTLVLIVDDHPINRLVLERQVNLLGYAAECAEDGREALEKWKSGRFALVLTDCNMPEMDGYELARAIRNRESAMATRRTIVIACTANALKGEAENCLAAGMDDYIAKPVQLSVLLKKFELWLPLPGAGPAAGDGKGAIGAS